MPSNMLRNIPSVHELLESHPLKRLTDTVSRNVVVSGIRTFLDNMRTEAKNAAAEMNLPTPPDLAERIAQWILTEEQPPLRPVINATGILLHTGLGRAPLAAEAVADDLQPKFAGRASPHRGEPSRRLRHHFQDAERIAYGKGGPFIDGARKMPSNMPLGSSDETGPQLTIPMRAPLAGEVGS